MEAGLNQRGPVATALDGETPPVARGNAPARTASLPAWLTLEVALYAGLLALAAGLRLFALGSAPLSAAEAQSAVAAWHIARGEATDLVYGPTPLYSTAAVFFLLGANDLAARLLPALAGLWVVAWPYFVREQLGRPAALGTTLLLATSPSLVLASRSASGEMVALGLALLATLAWLRFRRGGGELPLAVAAVAAGLTVASGPAAIALLLPVGLAVAGTALAHGAWPEELLVSPGAWRRAGKWAALALVGAATGLLSQPYGLQGGVIESAAAWLAGPATDGRAWSFYLIGLPVYEPTVLVLAALGLVFCRWERARLEFLFLWAALALAVYSLVGAKPSGLLAFVAFPLALAGGRALAALWEVARERMGLADIGLFLAAGAPIVAMGGHVASYLALPGRTISSAVMMVPVALFIFLVGAWSYWRGTEGPFYGTGCLLAVVLLGAGLHTSTALAFTNASNPAELLVGTATSPDLRRLVTEVADHEAVLGTPGRHDITLAVDAQLRYPLAWYFRDYTRLTYFSGTPPQATAVIASADAQPPTGSYKYQRYTLMTSATLAPASLGEAWRWLVYRDYGGPQQRRDAQLFVATQAIN